MKKFSLPMGENPLIVAYHEGVLGRSSPITEAEITSTYESFFLVALPSQNRPAFERASLVDTSIRTFVSANTNIA